MASLPALANVGLASGFYTLIQEHAIWAQLAGIVVVYIWNYAASSRFVWNTLASRNTHRRDAMVAHHGRCACCG